MPTSFVIEAKNTAAACKTLATAVTTLKAGLKTYGGNYDNACNMLYASEDTIKELKGKVAKGNDAKAVADLKKWLDNHPKIAARVKPAYAEVEKLRAGVAQAKKAVATIDGTLTKLTKDAANASKDDQKVTATDMKTISTTLDASDKTVIWLAAELEKCCPFPKTL